MMEVMRISHGFFCDDCKCVCYAWLVAYCMYVVATDVVIVIHEILYDKTDSIANVR